MSDTKRSPRWAQRLRVRFWRKVKPAESFLGYTSNFSNSGAFISTRNPVGTNSRIKIEIGEPPNSILLEGVVARTMEAPAELREVMDGGMGVRLLSTQELLEELRTGSTGEASTNQPATDTSDAGASKKSAAEPISSSPTGERKMTGAASRPIYPVRFATFDQFRQLYDRDLRIGGMFITTPEPAAESEQIQIRLELPGDRDTVEIRARVVRKIPPQETSPGGMAVEFVDADNALAQLQTYASGDQH